MLVPPSNVSPAILCIYIRSWGDRQTTNSNFINLDTYVSYSKIAHFLSATRQSSMLATDWLISSDIDLSVEWDIREAQPCQIVFFQKGSVKIKIGWQLFIHILLVVHWCYVSWIELMGQCIYIWSSFKFPRRKIEYW